MALGRIGAISGRGMNLANIASVALTSNQESAARLHGAQNAEWLLPACRASADGHVLAEDYARVGRAEKSL